MAKHLGSERFKLQVNTLEWCILGICFAWAFWTLACVVRCGIHWQELEMSPGNLELEVFNSPILRKANIFSRHQTSRNSGHRILYTKLEVKIQTYTDACAHKILFASMRRLMPLLDVMELPQVLERAPPLSCLGTARKSRSAFSNCGILLAH